MAKLHTTGIFHLEESTPKTNCFMFEASFVCDSGSQTVTSSDCYCWEGYRVSDKLK